MYDDKLYNQDLTYESACERAATPSKIYDEIDGLEIPHDEYRRGYRDASKRFLYILNNTLSFVLESKNSKVAAYQVGFALGAAVCGGRSMQDVGDILGVTRAALSKGAKSFCKMAGVEPSSYMRKISVTPSYRDARLNSITQANIAATKKSKTKNKRKK